MSLYKKCLYCDIQTTMLFDNTQCVECYQNNRHHLYKEQYINKLLHKYFPNIKFHRDQIFYCNNYIKNPYWKIEFENFAILILYRQFSNTCKKHYKCNYLRCKLYEFSKYYNHVVISVNPHGYFDFNNIYHKSITVDPKSERMRFIILCRILKYYINKKNISKRMITHKLFYNNDYSCNDVQFYMMQFNMNHTNNRC